MKLLPVEFDDLEIPDEDESNVLMNYEPNEEDALDMIIPKYVTSLFYGAFVEAVASENGARMQDVYKRQQTVRSRPYAAVIPV